MGFVRTTKRIFSSFGINLSKFKNGFKGAWLYFRDLRKFKKTNDGNIFPLKRNFPIFSDRFDDAGKMSGHYFHQDFYVAQRIFAENPKIHLDIGSRIDGFIAHVAVFREIYLVDVRPVNSTIENIKFIQADLTQANEKLESFADSISCLHAIEHFGLGRYNDPIDPEGHIKGLNTIYNCLRNGGKLYFSTPIGPQRIEFNAHRVFSIEYLLSYFTNSYDLVKFSYVDDGGDFHEGVELNEENINNNLNCNYGCGIFELVKKEK